jgi:hypothetical protein
LQRLHPCEQADKIIYDLDQAGNATERFTERANNATGELALKSTARLSDIGAVVKSVSIDNMLNQRAAVMQRIGRFGRNGNPRLEMIDRVDVEIRTAAEAAITRMTPEIQERYTVLLTQEINYAFNLERGAAA